MERIEKALEEMGIGYKVDETYGRVQFHTDTAGQDICEEFDFDGTAEDFVREFSQRAEDYDVDDQVEMYADMRGQYGVPDSIRTLLDDCQEAKDTLMDIAEKLKEAIA